MQHTYAQINDAGICIAESTLSAAVDSPLLIPIQWVDGSHIGQRWDGAQWHAGPPAATPAQDSRITRLAFRNRFTQPEKVTLELAALDNPYSPPQARQQAAGLRSYLKDLDAATFVDLKRPDTAAAVQMLEAAGLIGAGRAADILGAPIQPHERAA